MRRLGAAIIDYMISYLLNILLFCMIVSTWRLLRVIFGGEWNSYFGLMLLLALVSFCISNMVYSIFFDTVFHGHTPGKKLVGYNGLGENEKEHDWIIKHAICRTISSILYPITAAFYLRDLRMPYDRFLEKHAE